MVETPTRNLSVLIEGVLAFEHYTSPSQHDVYIYTRVFRTEQSGPLFVEITTHTHEHEKSLRKPTSAFVNIDLGVADAFDTPPPPTPPAPPNLSQHE